MNSFFGQTVKCRVRIFFLSVITVALNAMASSVTLSIGGNELQTKLNGTIEDTIYLSGAKNIFVLAANNKSFTGTVYIIGDQDDPDNFPVINHTGGEFYSFFLESNVHFEKVIFESSTPFKAQEPGSGTGHKKTFKQCVFRNGTGGAIFEFASGISSEYNFENCLFTNNERVFLFNLWSVAQNISFTNCTFDDNATVFYIQQVAFTSGVMFKNCIFSNNTNITSGNGADFLNRITGQFTGDPLYVSTTRTDPSDWKLSNTSPVKAYYDTTGSPMFDIGGNIRGSENGKLDGGCWALILGGAPEISAQPEDSLIANGGSASFTVAANGSEPLSYQWYRNGEIMSGEESSVLQITSFTVESLADTVVQFYCKVKNNIDSVNSEPCTLFVLRKPDFNVQPVNKNALENSDVSFTASALRAARYHWVMGNDSIPGSESSTLNLTAVTTEMDGNVYRCVAFNIAGTDTSEPAILSVFGNSPVITKGPKSTSVLSGNSALFFVEAQGKDLAYKWYVVGSENVIGTDDSLVISPTASGKYYCVVSNTYGTVTSDTADLLVIDPSDKNPIFIKNASLINSKTIKITISGYTLLPTAVSESDPYVDTIGIWYEQNAFPSSPVKNVPNSMKIAMSTILAGGQESYEITVTVPNKDCDTFCFVASPFWQNPENLPAFDTTKGLRQYMCSTEPLANPLSLKAVWNTDNDEIDVTIENIDDIDKQAVEYMSVWCTSGEKIILSDNVNSADLSGALWKKSYSDPIFTGPEVSLIFHVRLKGVFGNYSDNVDYTLKVGIPRTVNYIALNSGDIQPTEVELNWDTPYGEHIEKVKILYGTTPIPVDSDIDTTQYESETFDYSLKTAKIKGLQQNTVYYFGLQAYASGQYWSFVTKSSNLQVKTMNPDDVLNAISISGLRFDPNTNKVILSWQIDTVGMSDMKLWTGICWDLDKDKDISQSDIKVIDSTVNNSFIDSIDIGNGFPHYDTTYHFTLLMGYIDKDGGRKWTSSADYAKGSVIIKYPTWQKITYFKGTDPVSVYNQRVVLEPDSNWSGEFEDTLLLFKPSSKHLKEGLVPVSIGVDFKRDHLSSNFYLTMKYDQLPSKDYTIDDVYLYHFDTVAGLWSVMPKEKSDASKKTVTTLFRPAEDKQSIFILLIDTIGPKVTILSDTFSIVNAKTTIIDSVAIHDNIINSNLQILLIRNGEGYSPTFTDTADSYKDTLNTIIDANAVSQNNSIFAFLVVSDGRNSNWINISRRVHVDFNNATLAKDSWSPVFSRSELKKSDAVTALNEISFVDKWTYDITKFRIYTWTKTDADTNSWVEFSDEDQKIFDIEPGKILWVKSRTAKAINLGKGFTFPLKNTYSDFVLTANSFTDFVMPLHFNVIIQDVLDSTLSENDETELGFYSWKKDERGRYQTTALYVPGAENFDDSKCVLQPDSCYTIFNSGDEDIKLRIPMITQKLSSYYEAEGQALLKSQKKAGIEKWNISVNPIIEDGRLSPVYCGFAAGEKGIRFPVSPSFCKVRAGILDSDKKHVYGTLVKNEKNGEGISYPLVFENGYAQARKIAYGLQSWGTLPSTYKVAVFNPETGIYEKDSSLNVAAGEKAFRYLVVGSESYHREWITSFPKYSFSLLKAFPNPFRSMVQIQFMMPYSGVDRMQLAVFDQLGRRLWAKELNRNQYNPGINSVIWNPSDRGPLATGTYILQLTAMDGSGKVKGVKRERIMFMP